MDGLDVIRQPVLTLTRLACQQPWQGPQLHSVLMMTSSAGFGQTCPNSGSLVATDPQRSGGKLLQSAKPHCPHVANHIARPISQMCCLPLVAATQHRAEESLAHAVAMFARLAGQDRWEVSAGYHVGDRQDCSSTHTQGNKLQRSHVIDDAMQHAASHNVAHGRGPILGLFVRVHIDGASARSFIFYVRHGRNCCTLIFCAARRMPRNVGSIWGSAAQMHWQRLEMVRCLLRAPRWWPKPTLEVARVVTILAVYWAKSAELDAIG